MGLPGSGKTTVSRSLARERNGTYFSASTALEDYARIAPTTVARWRLHWARGEMAPDEEVLPVLWNRYRECSSHGTVFLDGYPRTDSQLEDFFSRGGTIEMALLLETSTVVARKRLLNRQAEESRLDDKSWVIDSRIARGGDQIKLLVSHRKVQAVLEVIECSNLSQKQTLNEALRLYDSKLPRRQPKFSGTACPLR